MNGVGLVKLMGRYSGFIAMQASLANNSVDFCLIPELPFELGGEQGLFNQVFKWNTYCCIALCYVNILLRF